MGGEGEGQLTIRVFFFQILLKNPDIEKKFSFFLKYFIYFPIHIRKCIGSLAFKNTKSNCTHAV